MTTIEIICIVIDLFCTFVVGYSIGRCKGIDEGAEMIKRIWGLDKK